MNRRLPQRKSPRLQGYDYSHLGAYFITICTHLRQYHFGDVVDSKMRLSELGVLTHSELSAISERRNAFEVDYFVVMPNHLHMILVKVKPSQTTMSAVIGSYKAGVTRSAHKQGLIEADISLWQGRFHDHIIRNEADLNRLRRYILENPARWQQDTFYEW